MSSTLRAMAYAEQTAPTIKPPTRDIEKKCGRCGRVYDLAGWRRLAWVGIQTFDYPDGDRDVLALRNCAPPCGSTLSVPAAAVED